MYIVQWKKQETMPQTQSKKKEKEKEEKKRKKEAGIPQRFFRRHQFLFYSERQQKEEPSRENNVGKKYGSSNLLQGNSEGFG